MKIMKLLLIVLIFSGCEKEGDAELEIKQPPVEIETGTHDNHDTHDSLGSISVRKEYYADARQLYFREIKADTNHVNYNKAELDTIEINKIVSFLEAVYKLDSPESNAVFHAHKIHAKHCYSLNSIMIDVRTTYPEGKNFVNGKIPTGDTALDNIIGKYGFDSIKFMSTHLDATWIVIYTKRHYNLIPIMKEFKALRSTVFIEPNGGCWDGDNILLKRQGNKATIVFSKGEEDCPAGCIVRKNWEFEVEHNVARFTGFTQRG
jgi:hypothetical protein